MLHEKLLRSSSEGIIDMCTSRMLLMSNNASNTDEEDSGTDLNDGLDDTGWKSIIPSSMAVGRLTEGEQRRAGKSNEYVGPTSLRPDKFCRHCAISVLTFSHLARVYERPRAPSPMLILFSLGQPASC